MLRASLQSVSPLRGGGAERALRRSARLLTTPLPRLAHPLLPSLSHGGGGVLALASAASAPARGFLSTAVSGLRRLRQLEEEANRSPDDPARQLQLMIACNETRHSHVAVRR